MCVCVWKYDTRRLIKKETGDFVWGIGYERGRMDIGDDDKEEFFIMQLSDHTFSSFFSFLDGICYLTNMTQKSLAKVLIRIVRRCKPYLSVVLWNLGCKFFIALICIVGLAVRKIRIYLIHCFIHWFSLICLSYSYSSFQLLSLRLTILMMWIHFYISFYVFWILFYTTPFFFSSCLYYSSF